ncbi:hypothetical protein M6B38_198500 [Iris pallida]|uniref:Uncharacterized protein n=1 Tax=Iris pallida TaxID=29817 RepID=A0AAX6EBD6_IRIPA|nr:hypothetical protein M6B38_198500 [Iris pallida]
MNLRIHLSLLRASPTLLCCLVHVTTTAFSPFANGEVEER